MKNLIKKTFNEGEKTKFNHESLDKLLLQVFLIRPHQLNQQDST